MFPNNPNKGNIQFAKRGFMNMKHKFVFFVRICTWNYIHILGHNHAASLHKFRLLVQESEILIVPGSSVNMK